MIVLGEHAFKPPNGLAHLSLFLARLQTHGSMKFSKVPLHTHAHEGGQVEPLLSGDEISGTPFTSVVLIVFFDMTEKFAADSVIFLMP